MSDDGMWGYVLGRMQRMRTCVCGARRGHVGWVECARHEVERLRAPAQPSPGPVVVDPEAT